MNDCNAVDLTISTAYAHTHTAYLQCNTQVSDFSWNANAIRTIASVSDDNILQIWQIADNIFMEGANESDAEDAPADDDLE
jgi:hypothetical protein